MRALPFFVVIFILASGLYVGYQSFTSPVEVTPTPAIRFTVTPRPRVAVPTSSPVPPTQVRPGLAPVVPPGGQPAAPAVHPAQSSADLSAATTEPTPTMPPTATPGSGTPTAMSSGQATLYVGNTGGEGVWIRRTPRISDKIRPWTDGTPMAVMGTRVMGDGHMWEHVRAPDGQEGYIPVEYMVGRP